ncbi:MAG: circadian clock protein KaiA [Cyanobacteria bacterium P01_E01_bin.45]
MSPSPLRVCIYQPDDSILEHPVLEPALKADANQLSFHEFFNSEQLVQYLKNRDEPTDCLILAVSTSGELTKIGDLLANKGVLLPAVALLEPESSVGEFSEAPQTSEVIRYHKAVITLQIEECGTIPDKLDLVAEVERAIALFLQMSPKGVRPANGGEEIPSLVQQQQRRLSEKLRERLGYAGVYYKRHPDRFYRNLSENERDDLIRRLTHLYRGIILEYFHSPSRVNPAIDEFVALAFLGDMSVSQVLEIHMQLMDNFAKQLKLEGRSEEIVLDYRITLIDVIAHLSEMYRRSIPRSQKSVSAREKRA